MEGINIPSEPRSEGADVSLSQFRGLARAPDGSMRCTDAWTYRVDINGGAREEDA